VPAARLCIDAEEFDAAARAGRVDALDVYRGELLPEDRYAPWAEEPRERLRTRYVALLKAARRWERVLEVEPADEEAHRALMQRALDAGDRNAAVRQFERLRGHLRADLGIGPDAESVALYERAVAMSGPNAPSARERVQALLARGLVQLNAGELA
jgi:DNA-binding SARP family transcriptional activator